MRHPFLAAILYAIVINGCENSEFSGSNKGKKSENQSSGAGSGEGTGTNPDGSGSGDASQPIAEIEAAAVAAGKNVESFDGAQKGPIDILFAMDTSGSMTSEKTFLETNMKTFLSKFLAANTEAQITAIGAEGIAGTTTGFTFPSDLPAEKFTVVNQKVGSHDAIGIIMNYFDGMYQTKLPLRKEAALEVVIITDDDGRNPLIVGGKNGTTSRNLAADFVPPAGKKTRVHAIVGLETSKQVTGVCEIASIGKEHIALATKYSGTTTDICTQDWGKLLTDLSEDIIKANRSIILKNKPKSADEIDVYIGNRKLEKTEFSYDAETNRLSVNDDVKIGEGEAVKVIYMPQ